MLPPYFLFNEMTTHTILAALPPLLPASFILALDCRAWQLFTGSRPARSLAGSIEDIDPPREVPGAADTILRSWNITACTGTAMFSGNRNVTRLSRSTRLVT